ncbi:MAG: hypothetical protein BWY63_01811 [Chloroflexi bacterium ADurb.Bin360]|nr:MAG: hypothetical protein BWY63_01811 [Chloroflexi bacterium ADurb.Bin360]
MKALVYCYKSSVLNNWLGLALAGIMTRPLTCPPLTAETFPYARLAEVDLVYIALHGTPKARVLLGDAEIPALDVEGILAGPRLRDGTVVILEGCYGAKTPFPRAFIERGATAVISSGKRTWDKLRSLGPAGRLGSVMVRALLHGASPEAAAPEGWEVLM